MLNQNLMKNMSCEDDFLFKKDFTYEVKKLTLLSKAT